MRLLVEERYAHWDLRNAMNMGMTAEKLFSQRAFSREEMDRWAKRSHDLAVKAQREGFFDGEILPIEAEQTDGSVMAVQKDQAVHENVSLEGLAQLKPAFKENGVITAGNSSPLNAAASSILLMAKDKAREKGINPLATVHSIGFAGVGREWLRS